MPENPALQQQNIFNPNTKPQKPQAHGVQQDYSDAVNNLSGRLRLLEERYLNLQRKTQLTEENMINNHKKIFRQIKELNLELREIKKSMNDADDSIRTMMKALQAAAKREDVDVISKYLDMWKPINFVTQDEIEKIVSDAVDRKLQK